ARNHEERAVDLIAQINANRPDGCGIADAESDGVRKIVQFVITMRHAGGDVGTTGIVRIGNAGKGGTRQGSAKTDTAQAAVDVSTFVEESTTQLCTEEG